MNIQTVSLKDYTSLRIGGEADMVTIRSEKELVEAIVFAEKEGLRVHILGGGTNTFFGEELQDLLILKMEIMGKMEEKHEVRSKKQEEITNNDQRPTNNDSNVFLTAFAGETWDDIVKYAADHSWWGIENLSHIPGTVGAAPVQNIGAYGSELKDVLVQVHAYDILTKKFIDLTCDECDFSYRDSLFKKNKGAYILISITLRLSNTPTPVLSYAPLDTLRQVKDLTVSMVRDCVIEIRRKKLPDYKEFPNAGSFFKNPIIDASNVEHVKIICPGIPLREQQGGFKIPAAWLIEHVAEMKGIREGDLGTWPHQPLVIVNYGEARANLIIDFSEVIIKRIQEKTGIVLEREVQVIT